MPETTYEAPSIPTLLTLSSFLYLNSAASSLFDRIIHANLLGPLLVGIIYGPQVAGILPADALTTFINVGYIGLLIIIFEAGLTTDLSLLVANIALSVITALTGIMFPIGFSFFLLYFAFWRAAYDVGLGWVLTRQSKRKWIVREVQRRGWLDEKRRPEVRNWIRQQLAGKMGKDYSFDVRYHSSMICTHH